MRSRSGGPQVTKGNVMTELFVSEKKLVVEIRGWDKLWTLKSRLEIPLEHVRSVHVDPEIARQPKGLRTLGTHVPGVITAGTFRKAGERVFWNVRHPEKVIVVELRDERYARLVLEVADPAGMVATLNDAMSPVPA